MTSEEKLILVGKIIETFRGKKKTTRHFRSHRKTTKVYIGFLDVISTLHYRITYETAIIIPRTNKIKRRWGEKLKI